MKISTRSKYGIRAVVELAMQESKGRVSLAEIAEKQGLSFSYLEQIFSCLRKAGIVVGTTGSAGGYQLSQTALNMNLYEILLTLEGSLSMSGATMPNSETPLRSFLRREVWDVMDDALEQVLKQTTLLHLKEEFGRQEDSNFSAGL